MSPEISSRKVSGLSRDGPLEPVSQKVPRTFRARRASCQTAIRFFWKADLLTCFWCKKMIGKFDGLERRRCEDIKGIVAPEIGPKGFATFEKQALGLKWLTRWQSKTQSHLYKLGKPLGRSSCHWVHRSLRQKSPKLKHWQYDIRADKTMCTLSRRADPGYRTRTDYTNRQTPSVALDMWFLQDNITYDFFKRAWKRNKWISVSHDAFHFFSVELFIIEICSIFIFFLL